jgi:hypothetical protein
MIAERLHATFPQARILMVIREQRALIHIARFHKRYARLRPVFERVSPRWIDRRMSAALRRAIDARVGAHFADSNRRTAALTGIDLRSLGYAVAQ